MGMKRRPLDKFLSIGNNLGMSYRTVEIVWQPHSKREWTTFTKCRKEAARLWSELVEQHYQIRRQNLKWPEKSRWEKWAKKKFPNLHSQSVQQIIGEFCEAVKSAKQLRKKGFDARYPWRKSKFRDVIYTNQAARIRGGFLILPNGDAGDLKVRIPNGLDIPGRLMEVRLAFGKVFLCCEVEDKAKKEGPTIGVDLGVNSVIAATDGKKAVVISGREIKATVQWRNKRLASLNAKLSKKRKGSRRAKKLWKRKHKLLDKAHNRIKDAVHKATRIIADEFKNAKCYVGGAFNDTAQGKRRKEAQQISQAVPGLVIRLLDYKTRGAIKVEEYYSSQTCPVCGERSKHRRIFKCPKCETVLPRDVVGALNNRRLGLDGKLAPSRQLPKRIIFKYPGKFPGSSGGHPASRSA